MATATRKSTGRAASNKGAASAVAKDKTLEVESDTPLVVDSTTDTDRSAAMERAEAEADAEDARQEAAARAETANTEATVQARAVDATTSPAVEETPTGSTVPEDEPAKITEGLYGPAGTKEEPVLARDLQKDPTTAPAAGGELSDPTAETPARDLSALRALADTSGQDPVTPYPGNVQAPAPVPVLPPVRNSSDWSREGDQTAKARVLVDGFRIQVNGAYRFARRGDIITAPLDVINKAVERGVLHKEG